MTLAEVDRAIASRQRVIEVERKQQASFYYTLADLIGFSVARVHNSNNKMPTISEVFPQFFSNEEEQKRIEKNRIEKFRAELEQFSKSHNMKIRGG